MTPGWFAELGRRFDAARAELKAEGFVVFRWDALPLKGWEGWESCRAVQVFGRRGDEIRRIEIPAPPRRRVRRVKRFAP